MQMARQYCPSALFAYRTQYIHVRSILCQQGGRFSDCEWISGPADMENSCEITECAAAESQQRTVHQNWGWKEGRQTAHSVTLNVAQRGGLGKIIWNDVPSNRAEDSLSWEGRKTGYGVYYLILNKRQKEEDMGDLSKRRFIIWTLIQWCWNYQIKENVLNRTCDKYGEKRNV
jgi:hypothetical protein